MQSITLEALKEQFCVKDKEEALVKIRECLDMAAKMMAVNDMGYKALAEETEQRRTCGEV